MELGRFTLNGFPNVSAARQSRHGKVDGKDFPASRVCFGHTHSENLYGATGATVEGPISAKGPRDWSLSGSLTHCERLSHNSGYFEGTDSHRNANFMGRD